MEEEKLFSIGEVSKLYHISVGNLRHYEKMGLLMPEYVNPDSGYRYYSVKQFECLNTIRYLRALDMPLEKIKEFLTNRDIDNLETILLNHQQVVAQKRRELELISRKIESRLHKLHEAVNAKLDEIAIVQAPSSRLAILKTSIIPKNYLSLEDSLRKLDEKASTIFLGKVGLGLTKEALNKRQFIPYEMVFLILDEEDEYNGNVIQLPEEQCVTILFRGGHENAMKYYEKLLDYIKINQLEIAGMSKEITLIDYGVTNETNQFVTQIQIPVVHS